MARLLEEFAYGNVPLNDLPFKERSEYGRITKLTAGIERKLQDRLGADDRDLFEKYVSALEEANQLAAVKHFEYGYRLGLVMTAEAFVGMDELIAGVEEL